MTSIRSYIGHFSAQKTLFPEKSTGKNKNRISFDGLKSDPRFSIALKSLKLYSAINQPKIRFWEGAVLLKVVVENPQEQGCFKEAYVKVNASSLRKKFGITQKEFNAEKKRYGIDLTTYISTKIEEKIALKGTFSGFEGAKENADGNFNGLGRYVDSEREYEGHFKNNELNGNGVIVYKDRNSGAIQAIYEGKVKKDKHHGRGILKCTATKEETCEHTYVGQFRETLFKGTITYSSGKKYVGECQSGKYHGKGELRYNDGCKEKGEFKDGDLYNGILSYKKGKKYRYVNGLQQQQPEKSLSEKILNFLKGKKISK
ncbi:MORN repeat-containing protein [Parachlamydia acanthamoebae]|uniref:MORN repeat protein n=2 Tax=Parachlamydia acanthamoebae TaxID=83552 RepID=F8L0T7_PARAV|nr:hypothetical protein [Parachlamydia acanthamoebae]KIA77424.1 hypothetical protein DB43_GG00030 [Parachlamydia acanthamoebae]CCB86838.1 putative uncharacterized protein [Parachlamydia acanthamoebae UV-7]